MGRALMVLSARLPRAAQMALLVALLVAAMLSPALMRPAWADGGKPPAPQAMMIDRAWIAEGDCGQPGSVCVWHPVTLPDHWGIDKRTGVWTYRIELPAAGAADGAQAHALWLPRAGDRLMLWLNGQPLSRLGRIHDGHDSHAQWPLWLPVSPAWMRPQGNELRIVAASSHGRMAGLSRVRWGPAEAVIEGYQWRTWIDIGGSAAIVALSVLTALMSAAVAWRTRHIQVWVFTLCSALWALREIMRIQIAPWPDPVGWYAITVGAYGLTVLLGSWLQVLRMQIRARWMYAPMLLVLLAFPWAIVAAFQAPGSHVLVINRWMLAAVSVGTVTAGLTVWNLVRHPGASQLAMALGCMGCVALSFADQWNFFLSGNPLGYERITVTSYMGLSMLLGISVAAFLRVDRAMQLEAVHKTELERQVQAQRQELQALHAREQARASEQAVADERARLMQDMHDGLGSRLVGLMSTVQSGAFTREELAQDLGEAMDELRLTLDSLSSAGEDLSSLLGQLRFRLAPRWRKLGIRLHWQVDELPTGPGLGPSELASLQRLLHEAFSNILKHARATRVQVRAYTDQNQACHVIEISDDGVGFDPADDFGGHGLPNMRRRAALLGGEFEILSSQGGGGTRIRIKLPAPVALSPRARAAAEALNPARHP